MKIECSATELVSLQKTDEVVSLTKRCTELQAEAVREQVELNRLLDKIHDLRCAVENKDIEICRLSRGGQRGMSPAQFEVLLSIPGVTGGGFQQFCESMRAGRKIDAIKLYRVMTDCGLKEAKDAVEILVPPNW